MEQIIKKEHYTLFIDECGDPNLEKFDRTFPLFTLCGVLIPDRKLKWLENEINSLKQELWGNEDVVFHSREIRNCSKQFVNLLQDDIKTWFYARINEILGAEKCLCDSLLLHIERTIY